MAAKRSIVADRNIPWVAEAFSPLGTVTPIPGAAIDAAAVKDADLLLVRSTVRVGPSLLEGSRVRFVGTATIGTDHLDLPWLAAQRIAVSSAPGSNAPSVALWWAASMLTLSARTGRALRNLSVAIVGVGNVGKRVERVARALGMVVLRCDPPRARAEGEAGFVPLDECLPAADIVSLHVPLSDEGPDATRGLVGRARIARMRPGAWLVNACRGQVLDGRSAAHARRAGVLGGLVLDVFDPEPAVPREVVVSADLATPHIAGHSLDGKAAGTKMILDAACAFLGEKPRWTPARSLPPQPMAALALDARDLDDEAAALALVRRFYKVENDDAALRRIVTPEPELERARAFRAYRDSYPPHREPVGVLVSALPPRPRALALIEALGATVQRD